MGNGYLVKVVLCGLDQGIARRLAKGVKVVSFVSANFKREKKEKHTMPMLRVELTTLHPIGHCSNHSATARSC